jgi:hypothetical protein
VALRDVVSSAVKIADHVTKSLQVEVLHLRWVSQDGFGEPVYSPPTGIKRFAIYEQREQEKRLADGKLIAVQGTLTFTAVPESQGTTGRTEPVDLRDLFVLPNGTTAPTVYVNAPVDPATGKAFVLQVFLGQKGLAQ